ncbi:MAG: EhaD family protein [Methanoregula sp.]|jgi:energy-converting hydrogenase A subunit D|nr:EhaD family protein [Methanoregula sp.]
MDEIVMGACVLLVLIGTFSAIFWRDPFDKLISLSVMIAGIFPFIVDRGYLDVAAALALITPLSTIFILMVCQRREPS